MFNLIIYNVRVKERNMKNVKKIGIALALVIVIAVGIVIGVVADGKYNGDIARFTTLVQAALDADTRETVETALVAAEAYITSNPIDPETEGYADIMELYRQAKLGAVDIYIESIVSTNLLTDKVKFAEKHDKWFQSAFSTTAEKTGEAYEEYLAKVHASNVAVAYLLYADVNQDDIIRPEADAIASKADGNYRTVKSFFDRRVFDDTQADYTELGAAMSDLTALFDAAKNARYEDLIAQARMDDYGVKPAYKNSFEGTTSSLTVSNYSGVDKNTGLPLKNTYGKVSKTLPDGSTNSYFEVDIKGARNSANTSYLSTYVSLTFGGVVDRFIMEMDFTSMTTLPNNPIYFQSRPSAGTNTWMAIQPNGDIVDHNGAVLAEKAIVPGVWTHIAIVCEMENINQSSLYVDYAYVGTVKGDHKGYNYTPENMRIGNSSYSSGQMCIDNLYVANNGSFCDQSYLNNMDDVEKFTYLCGYMLRTGENEKFINIPDCVTAYEKASEIVSSLTYKDADGNVVCREVITSITDTAKREAAIKAVEDYFAYDPSEIVVNYKKLNLSKYKSLVDALTAIAKAPTSTSISNRNTQVNKIQAFVNASGSYIFAVGDDFATITKGSGTEADPFILTHGDNALVYDAARAEAGWVYYKYVSKEAGKLNFSASGDGVVVAYLNGAEFVISEDNKISNNFSAAGEELIIGIKCELTDIDGDGAADASDVSIKSEFDFGYTYDSILATYSAEIERIDQDSAISKFITTMDGFQKATSATLLQSRYEAATQLVEDGLNLQLLGDGTDSYKNFYIHYTVTYAEAPAKIAQAKKVANSKDIVAAINYLLSTYPDEADWKLTYIENATTDEELANNATYEFIESYVTLIRGRISGGNYDPSYVSEDGVAIDITIQKFSPMNDYYYDILQGRHVELLESQLAVFANSDSYIEKKGIISYIQRYFNQEDVDFTVVLVCDNIACASYGVEYNGQVSDVAEPTCPLCDHAPESYRITSTNAALSTIINKYVAYEAELEPQKDDYDALLSQNTVYFLNAVKKFDTAITYVDKLALLNEAMPFYYAMNIGDEEVAAGVAKYDALAAELAVVQQDSKAFIENVLLIPAAREEEGIDGSYARIVAAAALRDKVDTSIEGVSEAIAAYEAEVASYEAVTETVNDEIKESANVLGSFGANCGLTAIISVVLKRLFSF